jgi:hypothetical protein
VAAGEWGRWLVEKERGIDRVREREKEAADLIDSGGGSC